MKKVFKRYIVFAYLERYANGGLEDVVNSFDDVEDAIKCFEGCGCDYGVVFDRIEGVVVLDRGDFEEE